MANEEHLEILRQGVESWNAWRAEASDGRPDLSGADLIGADLIGADLSAADLTDADLTDADIIEATLRGADFTGSVLSGADLSMATLRGATLRGADLTQADLTGADLTRADLTSADPKTDLKADPTRTDLTRTDLAGADLSGATLAGAYLNFANLSRSHLTGAELSAADLTDTDLSSANLSEADLSGADLTDADLSAADLSGAKLRGANLCKANLERANLSGADLSTSNLVGSKVDGAKLTGCSIFGISVWGIEGEPKTQSNLVITPDEEAAITVDNLKVAQFIYLLLYNEEIRDVIDTITSKVVLILGRFTDMRKAVLDAIRDELRKEEYDYVPVVFDFSRPANKTTLGTVRTLAGMARFVIADLTDAKSVVQELQAIVPANPTLPIQPLLLTGQKMPGMWDGIAIEVSRVLPTHKYDNSDGLIEELKEQVVVPAEARFQDLKALIGALADQPPEA